MPSASFFQRNHTEILHKLITTHLRASGKACVIMFSKFLRNPSPPFLLHFIWKHISYSTVVSKEGEVTTKHSLTHSFWKARTAFSLISLPSPSLLAVAYYSEIKFTQQNSAVLRPPVASTETIRLPAPVSPKTLFKFLLMPSLCVPFFQSNHMLKVARTKRS